MAPNELPAIFAHAIDTTISAQTHLLTPNQRLESTLSNSVAKGLPRIAIGPQQGQFLSILAQMVQAKEILEIGTLGGYSTIWFAESSPAVRVTAIEINSHHRDVALENMSGLTNVDVRLGAALDILPKLETEGKFFDFVFIDADWDEQLEYFEWAVRLTKPGAVIYIDNVIRQITSEDGNKKGWDLINYVRKSESEGRVQATLLPLVSTHKKQLDELVDGFLMALRK